ncbi:MAG: lmo0937 family membrane protein, partial [Flavobacterium sp.]
MRSLLYIVAVILVIIWALGSFAYHVGSALIHLLLVV